MQKKVAFIQKGGKPRIEFDLDENKKFRTISNLLANEYRITFV